MHPLGRDRALVKQRLIGHMTLEPTPQCSFCTARQKVRWRSSSRLGQNDCKPSYTLVVRKSKPHTRSLV
eukprot:4400589-Amphidinium_carterae.1